MHPLNAYMALEIIHDRVEQAERHRRANAEREPTRQSLRRTAAALRRRPASHS